jgi:hypothetical protein
MLMLEQMCLSTKQKKGKRRQSLGGVADGDRSSMGDGLLATDIEFLQLIYADIEEPDGMTGIAALRSQTTLREKIRDYESSGNWSDAQTCYEQVCIVFETSHHLTCATAALLIGITK